MPIFSTLSRGQRKKTIYDNRDGLWLHCPYTDNLNDTVRGDLVASSNASIQQDTELGNCLRVNGNGFCRYPTYDLLRGNELSVSIWVKVNSYLAPTSTFVAARTGSNDYNWIVRISPAGVLSFFTSGDNPLPITLQLNKTYLITITVDANRSMKAFIDGSLIHSQVIAISTVKSGGILVGGALVTPPIEGTNGWIKDVRVWKRALTQDEVGELWKYAKLYGII